MIFRLVLFTSIIFAQQEFDFEGPYGINYFDTAGPFTVQAKEARIQKEVRENYETYFARASKTRMWFPHKLQERQEMAKYGHMVSDNTREILLGFLGVESFR